MRLRTVHGVGYCVTGPRTDRAAGLAAAPRQAMLVALLSRRVADGMKRSLCLTALLLAGLLTASCGPGGPSSRRQFFFGQEPRWRDGHGWQCGRMGG